jgi:hypothetical protein
MFPAILSMTLRLTLAGAVAACAASPVFAQAADSGGGSVARSSARFSDAVELMRTDSSGNSVRVKVQNDDVVLVEVNGEAVPLDRARLSARAIEVLDADGKVLQRFDRPRTGGSAQGSAQGGARRVERGGQTSVTRDIEIMRSGPAEVRIASAEAPKSMIGIGLGEIDPALAHHLELDPATATLITNVIEELPAHLAGIERFDVIVAIDGSESAPRAEVAAKLGRAEPGTKFTLKVRRGAETAEVEVTTAAFDPTRIQGDLSERRAAEEQAMLDLFFVGPDGVRRGLRMPPMDGAMRVPGVAFEGLDPEQLRLIEGAWSQFLEDFESMPQLDAADPIEERLRRMEERMEEMRRKLEQGVEKRAEPGSKGR